MCRGPGDGVVPSKHCLKHSPEARAEARAAGKLVEAVCTCFSNLVGRHEELVQAKTKEAAELVLSRWQQMISDAMREWNLAKIWLLEKREAAAPKRTLHYTGLVAEVKDEEKRARAAEAVKKAEAALLEFEAAEVGLVDAQHKEALLRPITDDYTAVDLIRDDHFQARAETRDAEIILNKAWAALKPVDDEPDPKTGMPTRRKRTYRAAKRNLEAAYRHENRMADLMKHAQAPYSDAVANLTAAEARLEAAAQALKEANAERHSALSMGRPAAQVSSAEVALAA